MTTRNVHRPLNLSSNGIHCKTFEQQKNLGGDKLERKGILKGKESSVRNFQLIFSELFGGRVLLKREAYSAEIA